MWILTWWSQPSINGLRNDQGMVGSDSIVAGVQSHVHWLVPGTTKWPSDLQRLLPLRVIDPAPIAEPCPHSHYDHQNQWQNTGCPRCLYQSSVGDPIRMRSKQARTLRIHSTFRPSQVFVAGFPSESELNADRRLRSLITKLSGQGYRPSQIERFHFQSAQNGLSVKISAEPN